MFGFFFDTATVVSINVDPVVNQARFRSFSIFSAVILM